MNTVFKTVLGAFMILIAASVWIVFCGFVFRVLYACFMLGWGLV